MYPISVIKHIWVGFTTEIEHSCQILQHFIKFTLKNHTNNIVDKLKLIRFNFPRKMKKLTTVDQETAILYTDCNKKKLYSQKIVFLKNVSG